MDTILISIGVILRDCKADKRYRVICMINDNIVLCAMDTTKFELLELDKMVLMSMLSQQIIVVEDEESYVFDVDKLSEVTRGKYEMKRALMSEVERLYGPTFLALTGKKRRPELKNLLEKYDVPKNTFWRICTKYLQSGMKEISLIDETAFGINKGKDYQFQEKPGRHSKYFENIGVVLTEEVLMYFKEALKEYKSGRHKTIRSVYNRMLFLYYTKEELVNGKAAIILVPESERPTYKQLYNYIQKHLPKEERERIKTSAAEQRNDKRLCLSDSLNGVFGPGDMIEIDAWEVDVSLVSIKDENRTIGRPILYCMIDVYTKVILAISVSFDNNSVLAITNLFLNLVDSKKELCERYGIFYENDVIWPSNIIPRRIRLDRGAECKSKDVERICVDLGIERQLVPGATGSLKSVVENSFYQMIAEQKVHLENHGLIEKRYDSKHHQEATLNIEHYTKMALVFVLWHNQKYNPDYPVTREMLDQRVRPIPVEMWLYGVKKYGSPRPITSKEQYMFTLLPSVKAKVCREGIYYKGLWYFEPDDRDLHTEMYNAGNKKLPFEARMDMRDVGYLYYLRNGKLMMAPLNKRKHGNEDYSGMTMKQYKEYLHLKKEMDVYGRVHNEELSVFSYAAYQSIVADASKSTFSEVKDMRPAREKEKQMISHAGSIANRLEKDAVAEKIEPCKELILHEVTEVREEPTEDGTAIEMRDSISEFDDWDEVFDALSDDW